MVIDMKKQVEANRRYRAKKRPIAVITTETIEKEVLKNYNDKSIDPAMKRDLLKIMIDIWKSKDKVRNSPKDEATFALDGNINGIHEPDSST
jgi:hypothetical protein